MIFVASCTGQGKVEARFSLLNTAESGIDFLNQLQESDSINAYTYMYIYNGAGVGIADFNNDGLKDVFFGGNMVSSRLYLNKGELTFEDITESAGLITRRWVHGVSVVDINSDGFLDIYLSVGGLEVGPDSENLLFINNGDLTFEEASESYGLDQSSLTTHTAFFDYDRDGDLDAYLINYENNALKDPTSIKKKKFDGQSISNDHLLRNDNGKFVNVSLQAGINQEAYGLGLAIADFNEDSWLDIYVSNDFTYDDFLYINNGDGTFSDQIGDYLKHTSNFGMGIDRGDINNDGHIDMFQVDMLPEDNRRQKKLLSGLNYDRFDLLLKNGYMPQYMRNSLQLNSGESTYNEIGYLAGVSSTDWSWTPLIADLDNDGLRDLFVTNGYVKDVTDVDFRDFVISENQRRNTVFDPKVVANALSELKGEMVPNYAYANLGDYTFDNLAEQWGLATPSFSTGAAYGDLDNDGDLDLIVNNLNQQSFVYANHTTELDSLSFTSIELTVDGSMAKAVGAKVNLKVGNEQFTAEMNPYKGFQSTVDSRLHFGLGNAKSIDELEIVWPDGEVTRQSDLPVNLMLKFEKNEVKTAPNRANVLLQKVFAASQHKDIFNYSHKESAFVDFNREPLLPHMISREGPSSAVADVNGDGLDDIFIGGAAGQAGMLFVQKKINGRLKMIPSFTTDPKQEEADVLFVDIDRDNDLDLYVVSGGNEFEVGNDLYNDKVYLNDGLGNFSGAENGIDFNGNSGSVVVSEDFDGDGDVDLFVGGRCLPGDYPKPGRSALLANENGRFTDVTGTVAPELVSVGMVKDAAWADLNGDGKNELLVTGEFMSIHVYEMVDGVLSEKTTAYGLSEFVGWWNTLELVDIDDDGDLDILAGNLGLNSRYRATKTSPISIYADDFNRDGRLDAIMSYLQEGKEYIIPDKMTLSKQINSIKKKFVKNIDYAEATISDVIPQDLLNKAYKLSANHFETSLFINQGGQFEFRRLPIEAQFASVNAIEVFDFNEDGILDVLFGGNSFAPEVLTGRYDAQSTVLLHGMGSGNFMPMNQSITGLGNNGVVNDISSLNFDGEVHFLLLKNNSAAELVRLNNINNNLSGGF